jgi:hypothetical protein
MRADLSKYVDESLETEQGDELSLKVLFERVMVRSWTMSVHIEPVHWTGFQHAWLVATQIEFVNQNVHSVVHLLR